MSDRIRIFVTGGTCDKEYNELRGELAMNGRCFTWNKVRKKGIFEARSD